MDTVPKSPLTSTSPKTIKLYISCDRQIRPCIIVWSRNIPYTKTIEPIISKIPSKTIRDIDTLLTKTHDIDISSFYMSYSGQSWARSKYLHIKVFVKPNEFISKKLYPKWSPLTEDITKALKSRWNGELYERLAKLSDTIAKNDNDDIVERFLPDGYLYGVYLNKLYPLDSVHTNLQKLEAYLSLNKFEGKYCIYILPIMCKYTIKFFIASRCDEIKYTAIYPKVPIIADTYKDPTRSYYTRAKNVHDSSFILPTKSKITYKRSRKRRNGKQ